jgi:polyisoprenoid-binding protein YceI
MRKASIPFYMAPVLAGLALLLAGCQSTPAKQASAAPAGELRKEPAAGSVHYAVDAPHSEVEFLVYKAGSLAAFGHNHTVEAREFSGEVYLAPQFKDSMFALKLPVKDFEVDRAEARAAAGEDFKSKPSANDIKGTTEHMLGPDGLDAEKYPDVAIQSVSIAGQEDKAEMTVRITLHGTARDVKVPVAVSHEGDDLTAAGDFELRQSEFGMSPYSALGGALQVADAFKVHFMVLCHRQ